MFHGCRSRFAERSRFFLLLQEAPMRIDTQKMPKLGFGLMRLPEKDGAIDFQQVCRMVDLYIKSGFNYFDTAYVYHNGESEKIVKTAIVERYPRDSFTIATKLPGWCLNTPDDKDRIFNEQLERTGAGFFDYYLIHSIEDGENYDKHVNFHSFEWAVEKRKAGLIRHLGFSFHGTPELLRKILSEHPEFEFVQIQLNYADWDNPLIQSGALYQILREFDVPIIVMEPVKGGSLADPIPAVKQIFSELPSAPTPASLALRFVGSLDGIGTILSGMSTEEQMLENTRTFSPLCKLTPEEDAAVKKAVDAIRSTPLIECTSCRYCCDGCPQQIPIPDIFRIVNSVRRYNDVFRGKIHYSHKTKNAGKAADCIACGQCESVCPQHLEIISLLADASRILDD